MSTNTKWTPSANDRAILEALAAEAAKSPSQSDFVKEFCDFSASKWSKIMAAIDPKVDRSYFDDIKNPEVEMLSLAQLLETIPLKRALALRFADQAVYDLSQFRAVAVAVQECMGKLGPERLVKYLAPTGGGKSMLGAWLAGHKVIRARRVESREAWKRSYYTVLTDIAKAIGCRVGNSNSPSKLEDDLIRFCSNQKLVLFIDEGEFFGAQAINGMKLLLNKTRLTIVIAAIAEAHDKWNQYHALEASQLERRCHAIVELKTITAEDADKFFPKAAFKDREKSLAYICEHASKFGHYSLVNRVAERLAGVTANGSEDVKKAVAAAQREMQREPQPQPSTLGS